MLDPLRPAHVRDVNQSVDLVGDLHKGAKLRQVPHLAFDHAADWMGNGQLLPRIPFCLTQGQADPPLRKIELRHDGLYLVRNFENLGRIDDLLGPRHLADMDQALDTFLELDESTVVHQAHNLAPDLRAQRVLLVDQGPGVFRPLFVAQ